MNGSFTKLGIALTVIFVITLLALFVQLFYSLRRRRFFHRQVIAGGGADQLGLDASSDFSFSSKELLYFFCIRVRPQSKIESSSIRGSRAAVDDLNSNRQSNVERIDVDVFELQGMFGPPRFLFTIKEEEKEDLESQADRSLHSTDVFAKKVGDMSRNSVRSLEESFNAADNAAAVVVEVNHDVDTTPFSTPCISPSYFTPTASPVREGGCRR